MSLQRFMKDQRSSPEAEEMLRNLWDTFTTKPYFVGPAGLQLNEDYKIEAMRMIRRQDGHEFHTMEHAHVGELELVLFGEVCSMVQPGQEIIQNPECHKIQKMCFIYDGQFFDTLQVRMPRNASKAMKKAYRHQLEEMKYIVNTVAVSLHLNPIAFGDPDAENGADFNVTSPPIFKGGISDFMATSFNSEEIVETDDHPTCPRDALYDLQQCIRPNWTGFHHLNKNAVAIFTGKFKFWRMTTGRLQWKFFADSIKVIAQDA